jgi:hypothetical protein
MCPPNDTLAWHTHSLLLHMSLIGTKRTYRDVRYRSAFEGKADISQRLPNNRDL